MKKRLPYQTRRDQILSAAIELAAENGYTELTREAVAAKAGCGESLITYYFNSMGLLKNEVVTFAIHGPIPGIVAQAIINGSPLVNNIGKELRLKAADYVFTKKD